LPLIGFQPNSFLGDEWRLEFSRIVQGWLALLMILSSFSKSSRESFWPDKVRKKAGSNQQFRSLRTLRSFAAMESVFIRVHPWQKIFASPRLCGEKRSHGSPHPACGHLLPIRCGEGNHLCRR
jgi:hypothetical protein